MTKQKNDVSVSQRKRSRRLMISAFLLMIATLGLGAGFVSVVSNKVYRLQDWIFPYKAGIYKQFCIPWGDDGSYVLAEDMSIQSLTPTLYQIEIYVDGLKIADDDIHQQRMGSIGHLTTWCYEQGLDRGVYQMEFKVKDLQNRIIGAYPWTMTIE